MLLYVAKANANLFDLGERYFQTIGDSTDIPEGVVTEIVQDKLGFMWFGTQSGLVRYNGYSFKLFLPISGDESSLSGIYITALSVADDGRVWVGTQNNGVSVFDPVDKHFTRYQFSDTNKNGLSDNRVRAITFDNIGGVWIGTLNGLNYLPIGKNGFVQFDTKANNLSSNKIFSLLYSGEQTLWVGTDKGVNRYDKESGLFKPPFVDANGFSPFFEQFIWSLFEDFDGKIWLGSRRHGASWIIPSKEIFGTLSLNGNKKGSLSNPWVFAFTQPSKDEIWLGTFGGGISIFNTKLEKITHYIKHNPSYSHGINQNDIGSLYTDTSGLIWVGTWGRGVSLTNSKNNAFRTLFPNPTNANSITDANITALLETKDGQIFVATGSNGVDIIDPKVGVVGGLRQTSMDVPGLHDGAITRLTEGDNNTIWIGTRQKGLYRYSLDTKEYTNYEIRIGQVKKMVRSMVANREYVWIGTSAGILRLKIATGQFKHLADIESKNEPKNIYVELMAMQKDGTIWLASEPGLYAIPPDSDYLIPIRNDPNNEKSLSKVIYAHLSKSDDDKIWISKPSGLDKLVSWNGINASFDSYKTTTTIASNTFNASYLFDKKSKAWNSTTVFDLENREHDNLGQSEGIDIGGSWVGSNLASKSGLLLFGGLSGLLVVDPDKYIKWDFAPQVHISDVKIDDKPTTISSANLLTLSPKDKGFSVEYAALDFSAPKANKYAYRLKGFDNDWIETDSEHRFASYTNLDPGQYQLIIKGTNRVGQWSPHEITLDIVQQPAWHQTAWFDAFKFLLVLISFLGIYQFRLRQLNHQKEITEKLKVNNNRLQIEIAQRKESEYVKNALFEISEIMQKSLNRKEFYPKLQVILNRLMYAENCYIVIFDSTSKSFFLDYSKLKTKSILPKKIPFEGSLVGHIHKEGKAVILNQSELKAACKPKELETIMDEPYSCVGVPLITDNSIFGIMILLSFDQNHSYGKRELNIINFVSTHIAETLQRNKWKIKLRDAKKKLAAKTKKAEEANEAKSAFLATVSHEIRTPMNGVLGLVSLMKDTPLDKQQQDYVENISLSADSLMGIINNILDFSKTEQGKMQLDYLEFNLFDMLDKLVNIFENRLKQKQLSFNINILPDVVVERRGDPLRLSQILVNLVGNAIKFTDRGYVNIKIENSVDEHLKFIIEDTGIGIEEDKQTKIFDVFTQADESMTRKYGGSGLGLSICRQLVRMMGGEIVVETLPEKLAPTGSRFAFAVAVDKRENDLVGLRNYTGSNLLLISNDRLQIKAWDSLCCRFFIPFERVDLSGLQPDLSDLEQYLRGKSHVFVDESLETKLCDEITSFIDAKAEARIACILLTSSIAINNQPIKQKGRFLKISKPIKLRQLLSLFQVNDETISNTKLVKNNAAIIRPKILNKKILIVEDNIINQQVAREILRKAGALVTVVENGKLAVEIVEESYFDLVLMDMQMPVMEGCEATKIIRKSLSLNELPIVALTANILDDAREKCIQCGMNDYISKPIRRDMVYETIEKYLK